MGHEVHGGIRDVDGRIVGRDLAGVLGGVVKHRAPGGGCRDDLVRGVHQQVGAPAVGHSVVHAVDGVPGLVLQERIDVRIVLQQAHVDRLHILAGDQAQRSIPGGRDDVVLSGAHERHSLIRRAERLEVDLAPGLLSRRDAPSRPQGRCCRPRHSRAIRGWTAGLHRRRFRSWSAAPTVRTRSAAGSAGGQPRAAAATAPTTREALVLGAMILTFRCGVNRWMGTRARGNPPVAGVPGAGSQTTASSSQLTVTGPVTSSASLPGSISGTSATTAGPPSSCTRT